MPLNVRSGRTLSRRSRIGLVLTAFATAAVLGACQDKRVRAVDTGVSKDSTIRLLSGGAGPINADTFPHIHRKSAYLINRKMLEVLWFTPTDKMPGKDTLPFSELTPIVLYDNKVIGKGWDFWDSTARANNIAVQLRKDTTKK
jgi:hypothetical protein